MSELVVIVPSRGRPKAARELAEAFVATCTAHTELCLAVDENDPTLPEYLQIPLELTDRGVRRAAGAFAVVRCSVGVVCEPKSMVWALNQAGGLIAHQDDAPFAIGFMGDDHRPRTRGWDHEYVQALRSMGSGIVYGNDLLQGRNLPTQCAMTTDIVRTIGYMAPPSLTHLYVDNFWLSLGMATAIRYLPEVVVEHCHPIARKGTWDAGYARVNNSAMYDRDAAAFGEYVRTAFRADVDKVRELRTQRV